MRARISHRPLLHHNPTQEALAWTEEALGLVSFSKQVATLL